MTDFAKRCELEALVTERAKMETHDKKCVAGIEGTCYADADYDLIASRMRALAEEKPVTSKVPDEPHIIRRCDACAHLNLEADEGPCAGCFGEYGHPNWTPSCKDSDAGPCSCEEAEELRKRLSDTEDARDAATESLTEVAKQRDEARAKAEKLKQELIAAREQLPAWAKRFMRVGIAGPISCHLAECPSPNCSAWRNLTPDQRRQCEEP